MTHVWLEGTGGRGIPWAVRRGLKEAGGAVRAGERGVTAAAGRFLLSIAWEEIVR
jgi:hypothetical protein